jgi:hypothetical protein
MVVIPLDQRATSARRLRERARREEEEGSGGGIGGGCTPLALTIHIPDNSECIFLSGCGSVGAADRGLPCGDGAGARAAGGGGSDSVSRTDEDEEREQQQQQSRRGWRRTRCVRPDPTWLAPPPLPPDRRRSASSSSSVADVCQPATASADYS